MLRCPHASWWAAHACHAQTDVGQSLGQVRKPPHTEDRSSSACRRSAMTARACGGFHVLGLLALPSILKRSAHPRERTRNPCHVRVGALCGVRVCVYVVVVRGSCMWAWVCVHVGV